MVINFDDPARLQGVFVFGGDGRKLGSVDSIYYDNLTARPEWVAVVSGLFGSHVSLMPLAQAEYAGGDLRVPYDKEQLKAAPHHNPGRELSPADEVELFHHYGIPYDLSGAGAAHGSSTSGTTGTGTTALTGEAGMVGTAEVARAEGYDRDRQAAGIPDDLERSAGGQGLFGSATDDAMTRSEERLKAHTETCETGRARLRKYVVTEHQQVTVPVSHEEVTVEHEPITEANQAAAYEGAGISEAEHEVVLHEEQLVVEKEAVPVERVRLGTETVTEQETVGDEVRREEIELEAEGHPVREIDHNTR
jgi:uncharacterized protein (TIGR02271 family)